MRHILVTCATSHLGQGIIQHLSKQQYPLILLGRDEMTLKKIQHQAVKNGSKSVQIQSVNFSEKQSLDLFQKWLTKNPIDLQGTVIITPRPQLTDNLFPTTDEWQTMIQDCFVGPLDIIKSSLPFYGHNGKLVVISGISSLQVMPEHAAFGTLRAMWLAHAKALSHQLGPQGLHVNTLSPGGILTDYMTSLIQKKAENNKTDFETQYAQSTANVPLRKYASVSEIANIVAFFLSEQSDHITGTNIACDGGFTKHY